MTIQPCWKEIPVQDNEFVWIRPILLNQSFLYLLDKKNAKGRFHKGLREFHGKYITDLRIQQSFHSDLKKK